MIESHITPNLLEALQDTPVVFLRGARQTGKSTLVQAIIRSQYPAGYITLDSTAHRSAAASDPTGFLSRLDKPVVIDEVQRVPELFLAIKEDVDRNRKPGRFLLTGSANILALPQAADSLAGRMELVTLHPLSQGEIEGIREDFIPRLFRGEPPGTGRGSNGGVDFANLMVRMVRGGYPEAVGRAQDRRRSAWFDSYLTTILERDVRDLSHIQDITSLPRLLRLLAARTATLPIVSDLSRETGIPGTSLHRYMTLLETIFILQMTPAWSVNLGQRLIKSSKMTLADVGLVCHLMGLDAARLLNDPDLSGRILENFVIAELYKQMSWCGLRVNMHHFRSAKGQEVDIVLEDASGKIVGIEVKLSSSATAKHFSGLKVLQGLSGERWIAGVVLYAGEAVVPFGEKLWAAPIATLWGK
jgi:predicted AAA+ superfamily ATPase